MSATAVPGAAAGAPQQYVAYFRVSTDRQGRSGLGLDAQREAVAKYVAGAGGVVAAEYEEVESGKRNDRPQLAAALAACRARRATLIIAKLGRKKLWRVRRGIAPSSRDEPMDVPYDSS